MCRLFMEVLCIFSDTWGQYWALPAIGLPDMFWGLGEGRGFRNSVRWDFGRLKSISPSFRGSTLVRDISFHAFFFEVHATACLPAWPRRTAISTWHIMAAAWLQHEANLQDMCKLQWGDFSMLLILMIRLRYVNLLLLPSHACAVCCQDEAQLFVYVHPGIIQQCFFTLPLAG